MNPRDPADTDRAAIARTTAELLGAVNASDADRCFAVWADDGVLMPPSHPSVQGSPAIREYFRRLFSRARFNFTFTSSDICVAGDIALERVAYATLMWAASDASPTEDRGKGLHVYRRQSDGSWKLALDIWNSDLPGSVSADGIQR